MTDGLIINILRLKRLEVRIHHTNYTNETLHCSPWFDESSHHLLSHTFHKKKKKKKTHPD